MGNYQQELEIKLYLADMVGFKHRVESLGANLVEERLHEINLRFDTPDGRLSRAAQVLRLRQDTAARVTFKGPGETLDGVYARREIEFTASDYQSAQALLEALGYQVSMMYEKYRTTFNLSGLQVTLDEMPYGNFTEIEGSNGAQIRAAAEQLGVNWEARINDSYTILFDQLKKKKGLTFQDLSFENFRDLQISPSDLGVTPADI